MTAINLSLLPPPDIIESLDFELIYAARCAYFLSLYPEDERAEMAARLEIEGEPIVIVLQAVAYAELILRARINDAARSNLLAFATGGDLDQLGAFYDVARMTSPGGAFETDARFRRRIQIQIAALAGNGTREVYIGNALKADEAVKDAAVLSPLSGHVEVALWISDYPEDRPLPPGTDYDQTNALHHAQVLDRVREAFAGDDARLLGIPLTVYEAAPVPVSLTATLYREASAPAHLVADIAAHLPVALAAHAELGRDVARSLVMSWLHVVGISRVELATPAADIVIPADGYAVAGTLQLIDGGTAW
jgi:phage-related baseplate assembly protein